MNSLATIDQFFGLDIGRDTTHAVLSLIERVHRTILRNNTLPVNDFRYLLTFLKQFPLGTPFPHLVDSVTSSIRRLRGYGSVACPYLVADATGVGAPLIDQFRKIPERVRLLPVIITSGSTVNDRRDGTLCVPRRDLMMAVSVMTTNGTLRFASNLQHRADLIDEMLNIDVDGHRRGTFFCDDMIMSIALAAYRAQRFT